MGLFSKKQDQSCKSPLELTATLRSDPSAVADVDHREHSHDASANSATKMTESDVILVEFEPNDPENPMNVRRPLFPHLRFVTDDASSGPTVANG